MIPWLPLCIAPATAGILPVEIAAHTLPNGLRIYLAPMDTPGVVSLQTWVAVGSGNEIEPGTTGHAHFLEHLLFADTDTWPASERDRALMIAGAEENAWTWLDDTVYHLTLPSRALPELLDYDAGRFQRTHLPDEAVRREAGAVQGEWRQSKSWTGELAIDAAYATAFPGHPYGHPTLGTDADVAAMPGADPLVEGFLATWYRPETLRIVVAGDFDPQDTLTRITSLWGSWAAPDRPLPEIPPEPAQREPRALTIPPAQVGGSPWLVLGWRVPGRDLRDPDSAALAVLDELLLGEVSSLRRELVDDSGQLVDLHGDDYRFRQPHLFLFAAELKPETAPAAIQAGIVGALGAIAGGELDAGDLARAKARMARSFRLGLDDPHRLAGTVGWATAFDPDPAVVDAWFEAIAAVTAADLAGVIGTYFVPEGRTAVVVTPEEAE